MLPIFVGILAFVGISGGFYALFALSTKQDVKVRKLLLERVRKNPGHVTQVILRETEPATVSVKFKGQPRQEHFFSDISSVSAVRLFDHLCKLCPNSVHVGQEAITDTP